MTRRTVRACEYQFGTAGHYRSNPASTAFGDFPAELRERVMWTSAGAVNIA
jgi:hypothetical protein